ncbi:(2Fe-2S)-binding protein [Thermasporomyces composti]|uniref:Ferric iron reductase protein FhuF n=1 Tax=Thermasporomyces composti TaxID=696763 RepID=A0A3D9V958_THECX|nr:(2Fe-2S)-binding protein [Thermasporomyces composti]REF38318.1 ferric iron reductase protein FhuF [Thermasporomyces composti]
MDFRALLAELESFGEYFTVVPSTFPPRSPSLAQLYSDDRALGTAIDVTARALRTSERRVGASILVQGLAARLWSPVLAVLLLHDRVLTVDPATTWWAPGDRLHVADVRAERRGGDAVLDLRRAVVEPHLVPLLTAVRRRVRLPEALLWGNVASALLGSLDVLTRARPDVDADGERLARSAFGQPPLDTAGCFADGRRTAEAFTRSSCCLYYRVPGGGWCGDCALSPRHG